MNLHVWAFDPGQTTGWCHLSIHGNLDIPNVTLKNTEVALFRRGQANHFEIGDMFLDHSDAYSHHLTSSTIETVFVCESFQMTPGKSPAHWSLETIGLIRYWSYYYSIPLIMITPSSHKTLISNEVLKRAELWTPGQKHARDATSLALYYLIKERRLLTECLKN